MTWLAGVLVLLGVGLWLRLGLLVYAMYVVLGVLLVSRWLSRAWIGNLEVTRESDTARAEIGETAEVTVTVLNRSRLPVPWVLLEDALPLEALRENPPRLKVAGVSLALARLAGQGEETLSYQVSFAKRGYYAFGPTLLESGDVFGLQRRYRVASEPHYVMVPPKVIPVEQYDFASPRPLGETRLTHRLFEDPALLAGVRAYQKGDPLRRVHWRATARTGTLQSRVYEPSAIAGATFVLDFHAQSYTGRGGLAQAELAVTAVASLAQALYQRNQPFGLVTNGRDAADRIRFEGWRSEFRTRREAKRVSGLRPDGARLEPVRLETQRGVGTFERLLETLARLEFTDGFTFDRLLEETVPRLPRNATVVAVLPRVTAAAATALGGLKRQGFAVEAVLILFDEPLHRDWAKPPEWAERLLSEGIEFRRVEDETTLAQLCASGLAEWS